MNDISSTSPASPGTTNLSRLGRAQAGEQEAQSELAEIYWPWLRNLLISRFHVPPQDADDHAQQTYLNAFRAMPKFKHEGMRGQFRGWLATVAENVVRQANRRKRPEGVLDLSAVEAREVRSAIEDEEESAFKRWALNRLRAQNIADCKVWELRFLQGMTPQEIAVKFGITTRSVQKKCRDISTAVAEMAKGSFGEG